MTVVEAINQLGHTLSSPSLVDYLMLSSTIVYVLVTTIIMGYNINLVKVTKNIQKQNIDLQLFEKRTEVNKKINDYFNKQVSFINLSILSLGDKFVIKNLSANELVDFKSTIQKCTILFSKNYNSLVYGMEKNIDKCFTLLSQIQSKLSEYTFIYYNDNYNEMILKMKTYFNDYYQDHINVESLEKCLNSIGADEIFTVFHELENEFNYTKVEEHLRILNELFEKDYLTFLVTKDS